MESRRYLERLDADAQRLRDVASRDLGVAVPSCPGWSVADLVEHVAVVYMHKSECMRLNAFPQPWPPDLSGSDPIALFDRAYTELVAEFAAREPDDQTVTWYAPEQTVGFWIRRMAQETVIHRVDAELAQGEPLLPIPDDIAVDGVDEVLVRFLGYISTTYRDDLGNVLDDCDGRSVRVETDGHGWNLRLTTQGVIVSDDDTPAAARLSGAPTRMLLSLWRRDRDDGPALEGDASLVAKLWDLLVAVTQ